MTTPNVFGPAEQMSGILDPESFLEVRCENDGSGNPIYIGYTLTPSASQTAPIWLIFKCTYVSDALTYRRLPPNGLAFVYSWSERATYFP